jgi:uncharacterized phosphosugar-binding protein
MTWIVRAAEVLQRIAATQSEAIEQASAVCADAIAADGVVWLFGTGHSRIPVEEMFPRYGSYPGFVPIVELSTTFYTQVVGANGLRQAMWIERQPGLAAEILANFDLRPPQALMVFSAGGRNAVPIEMAAGARERGLKTIVVTSLEQTGAVTPTHASGTRLRDHGDVVVDLCTPAADALVQVPGVADPVGPGSTLAYVLIVNAIKVRTAELLAQRGAMPPVITHASVAGEAHMRRRFDEALAEHRRRVRDNA